MFKKIFATFAIGVLAALAVPTTAQAYAPGINITINGNIGAGATVTIIVADNVFIGGEQVNFVVSGVGQPTLSSSARTVTSVTKTATAAGGASANLTLPTNARGTYTVTATGLESNTSVQTEFTVAAAASGSASGSSNNGLAATGINGVPMLAIWTASGLALLGAALIAVMAIVRRQRANG